MARSLIVCLISFIVPHVAKATRHVTSQKVVYSSVVVFGDSYSDDEHRKTEPATNPYAALGTNSTGILWPSILVKEMSPKNPPELYDYSYNGAHANKHLTYMGVDIPDTRDQIREYLSDLEVGHIEGGEGSRLYIWWIGINPIDAIWIDACDPELNARKGAQYPGDQLFLNAIDRIDKQVEEVRSQMEKLRANVAANMIPTSYLAVTVPNVDVAPLQHQYVQKWANGDEAMERDLLKLLKLLIERYNKNIKEAVHSLQIAYGESKGFIRTYDIVPLWNSILRTPKQYGIKNVTGSCLVGQVVCPDVNDYFFWDYLHLSPRVEALISHDIYNFILNQH
ncbi:family 16 carbohydrate esterase [Melampsora americana]|nr:family 16 carbohydrate esterase [Melampsora americana]